MNENEEIMTAEEFFGGFESDRGLGSMSSPRRRRGRAKKTFADIKARMVMCIYGVTREKAERIISERSAAAKAAAASARSAEETDLLSDEDEMMSAEYVAGTDPTDPDSKFSASIEMVDGKPVVTYSPDLLGERKYIKFGKVKLDDPAEAWQPVEPGQEDQFNFFKVTVEMP